MSDLQRWLLSLAATAVFVLVSYQWIDRPIAFYMHEHVRHYPMFGKMTQLPELFAPFAGLLLLWLGVRALMKRPLSSLQALVLLCTLSLIAAAAIKDHLKFAFGRTWPETWVRHNPSLIRDRVYG